MNGTDETLRDETSREEGSNPVPPVENPDLDWRDYVAICIALIQTTLLPVLLVILFLLLSLVVLLLVT